MHYERDMSKTYELLEKVVTEEFRAQTLEANSNIYLTAYSFIIGAIFLHIEEILSSLKLSCKHFENGFFIAVSIFFIAVFVMGILLFLIQCLRIRLPKADRFAPNLDVCRHELEERTRLLKGNISHRQEHSDQIDSLISDIIRLRIIDRLNEVIRELQQYNNTKRWFQRLTGICLMFAVFVGGQSIINAIPLRPSSAQSSPSQAIEAPIPK